tara:strand:+ start:845 stop:1417 length:573 start_codon:yes stop_codon:yes gene_type:complete
VKALTIWSGALAGLTIIIVGGMMPSAILIPKLQTLPTVLTLNSSWQVPGLILCSIICGANSGFIAVVAYLTIGLFYLPIFHGGGSIGYLLTPDFGYLAGFIPASLTSGLLTQRLKRETLISLTVVAFAGVMAIHITGTINLLIGTIFNRWQISLGDLLISYTLLPLPTQLILCPCIALIAISIRRLLLIK